MFTPPELFTIDYEIVLTVQYHAELTCPMADLRDSLIVPGDVECECFAIELSILDLFEKLDIL